MEAIDWAAIFCMTLGSLAGASVFGFVRPDRENFKRALLTAGLGVVISMACTPGLCRYLGLEAIEYKVAFAFANGVGGMTVTKAAVVAMQTEAPSVGQWVVKAIKKLFGMQE